MVFSIPQQYYQFVVVIVLLVFRFTTQKISSSQITVSKNQINIYRAPYIDTAFCRTTPGLTKYQRELCNQQPDTTMVSLQGLNEAVKECQSQFQGYRWNCSSLSTKEKNPYISAMFQKGYKETAYAYAISAASVAISVARACSSSSLTNCGCDSKIYKMRKPRQFLKEGEKKINLKPKAKKSVKDKSTVFIVEPQYPKEGDTPLNSKEVDFSKFKEQLRPIQNINENFPEKEIGWKWGGCSHNIKYGVRFSKMFLDSRETADDIHSKVNLHNNQIGRKAVQSNMQLRCKCHGISGSCQMKTCWRSTPDLKTVGKILKEKFKLAVLVDQSNFRNRNQRKFNIANPNLNSVDRKRQTRKQQWVPKRVTKKPNLNFDLLYYQKSPNYCENDDTLDISGTSGRSCNSTIKAGPNSCDHLCCGRGYNLVREKKVERRNCKFLWCCKVECDICSVENWVSVCK